MQGPLVLKLMSWQCCIEGSLDGFTNSGSGLEFAFVLPLMSILEMEVGVGFRQAFLQQAEFQGL